MSDTVAYALRADFEGTVTQDVDGEPREVPLFLGGLFRVGDRDLELRAALDDDGTELHHGPAGMIVVDAMDAEAINVLDAVPVLKRIAAPDGVKVSRWDDPDATKALLLEEAARRGIPGGSNVKRDELAEVLRIDDSITAGERELPDEARQARAAGELTAKALLEALPTITPED